ncbi:MAG TPA: YbhN family protein [Streptosporangiaceae bacterium]|nr:YbhN family protein [Streptosporangiaceae bacterium]
MSTDEDGLNPAPPPRRARGWRGWLPLLIKPLRRGVVLFIIVLIVEYLVVPELTGARKDLYLLNRVNGYWMAGGLVLEALSLLCYGLLTRALLRPEGRPSLFTLFRIDMAAAAVAHVIPAGTLGSAGIGYRLFTNEGISGSDAGVMMAAKGIGSTVVLNVLLWLSLVVSIPLAGFHPIYVTVAIVGALVLLAVGLLILGITRGTGRASRIMDAIGRRLPRGLGDRFGQAVKDASANFQALARDRRVLRDALLWASMNWILDAASLWSFVTAFGGLVNPVELFAAYGVANVAGALPVTPAGLGVVDSITPLLLVSFGVTRNVATLGVLGWRLVNFWLPIPAGALAYVSLKVPRGAGLRAMRHAVSGMMSRGEPANGTSGHPNGRSADTTANAGKSAAEGRPDGSGSEAAQTAESMSASDGSDSAGGPARGDFRVG